MSVGFVLQQQRYICHDDVTASCNEFIFLEFVVIVNKYVCMYCIESLEGIETFLSAILTALKI